MTDITITPPPKQTQKFLADHNKDYPELMHELLKTLVGKHNALYTNERNWFDTLEQTLIEAFPDMQPHQFDAATWSTISTHGNRIPSTNKRERINETLDVLDTAVNNLAEHSTNTESPHNPTTPAEPDHNTPTDNDRQTLDAFLTDSDTLSTGNNDTTDDEDDDPSMFA